MHASGLAARQLRQFVTPWIFRPYLNGASATSAAGVETPTMEGADTSRETSLHQMHGVLKARSPGTKTFVVNRCGTIRRDIKASSKCINWGGAVKWLDCGRY
jgi:hypothetical protein